MLFPLVHSGEYQLFCHCPSMSPTWSIHSVSKAIEAQQTWEVEEEEKEKDHQKIQSESNQKLCLNPILQILHMPTYLTMIDDTLTNIFPSLMQEQMILTNNRLLNNRTLTNNYYLVHRLMAWVQADFEVLVEKRGGEGSGCHCSIFGW